MIYDRVKKKCPRTPYNYETALNTREAYVKYKENGRFLMISIRRRNGPVADRNICILSEYFGEVLRAQRKYKVLGQTRKLKTYANTTYSRAQFKKKIVSLINGTHLKSHTVFSAVNLNITRTKHKGNVESFVQRQSPFVYKAAETTRANNDGDCQQRIIYRYCRARVVTRRHERHTVLIQT